MRLSFGYIGLFGLLSGWASFEHLSAHPAESGVPDALVRTVFIERVKNTRLLYEKRGIWDLQDLLPSFSSRLDEIVNTYVNDYTLFKSRYGKFEGSIQGIHTYLVLANFDPLTLCDRPPLKASLRKLEETNNRARFEVTYKLFGNRHPYLRSVEVLLVNYKGSWKIDEVHYRPNAIPALGEDQTLRGMLKFLSGELKESAKWAQQHPEELRTQSQMIDRLDPRNRGPFDR